MLGHFSIRCARSRNTPLRRGKSFRPSAAAYKIRRAGRCQRASTPSAEVSQRERGFHFHGRLEGRHFGDYADADTMLLGARNQFDYAHIYK